MIYLLIIKQDVMLVLAIIIYVVCAFLRDWDFIWPISALGGEGGCLAQILVVGWVLLLLAGLGVF